MNRERRLARPWRSFDRIAAAYRVLEYMSFGRQLERTRARYLPQLVDARHALVLGDGDGRFLAALLHRQPQLRAVAVDGSERMLELLAGRCAFAADRLTLHQADLRERVGDLLATRAGEPFDLVITHFFLDCLDDAEVGALIGAVRPRLAPGARWVVSEFRVPARGWRRLMAGAIVRALYAAFRLLTGLRPTRLPAYGAMLRAAGFERQARELRLGGLLTAELWRLPNATIEGVPDGALEVPVRG